MCLCRLPGAACARAYLFVVVLSLCLLGNTVSAAEYKLAIQPALTPGKTEAIYKPLADYLSEATGHDIKIAVASNFQAYWSALRNGQTHDMALDAAHFADYRVKKLRYTILAKVNDTVSFSLITREDQLVFDVEELIGKSMAAVPSPSLAGVNLMEFFPNPLRQPVYVPATNFPEALEKVDNGTAMATIVPTSLIRGDTRFNTVTTTDAAPHSAFSVSRRVDGETRRKIREALLQADRTPEGRAMLEAIHASGFERGDAGDYDGYAKLLDGVWGY